MTRLTWGDFDPDTDSAELAAFKCCLPPAKGGWKPQHKRKVLARPWEREVQTGIQDLAQHHARDDVILIGRDEEGIGAVTASCLVGGPGLVKMLACGVATRLRRQRDGYWYGSEAFEATIDRIAELGDAAGLPYVMLFGLVHPLNRASQAACERAGFTYLQDDGSLQEWWLRIDLA